MNERELDVAIPAIITEPTPEQRRELENLLYSYGNLRRRAYNMKQRGCSRGKILETLKSQTPQANSWYILTAYSEVSSLPSHVTFGGKENQQLRMKGKITKEEYKRRRNNVLSSRGGGQMKGNRCLRVVEKGGQLQLRVTMGIREWMFLDLFVPRKYLEEYGHLLDGSKPYKVVVRRRGDR